MESFYETHTNRYFISSELPFIFHRDTLPDKAGNRTHWHENPEFLLCTDGSGEALVASERYSFERGTLICVPSGELHRIVNTTAAPLRYDCLITDIHFCHENGLRDESMHFAVCISDAATVALFQKAAAACSSTDDPLAVLRIRTAVLQFLLNAAAQHTAVPPHDRSNAADEIKRVMLYVKNHYDEPVTLSEAAEIAGFSACYFSHKFKEATGVSFLRYLNTVRVEKAASLLQKGVSVTDTCYRCGFKELSYFSRTFKRLTGQTPSQLRIPPK